MSDRPICPICRGTGFTEACKHISDQPLREIAEQIISDFQHSEELAWEMVERAMRLAIEATRKLAPMYERYSDGFFERAIAARMVELLKAEAEHD